jgi:two-component system LytT family response regulator
MVPIKRVRGVVDSRELVREQGNRIDAAIATYESVAKPVFLERIPVRQRDEILIIPVSQIAAIIADCELLHLTSTTGERYTINYRLKDLELRLDPARFIRLGRGTLANVGFIRKIRMMPAGGHVAVLNNGQKLPVSRIQSRTLRERLLKL